MNRALVAGMVEPLVMSLGNDKKKISLALGVALAYTLPLPSSRQDNPELYYVNNYFADVNQFVSEFNERFLLETTTVTDVTRGLWELRYKNVFFTDYGTLAAHVSKACPIADLLAGYAVDDQTRETILSAACALGPKVEEAFKVQESHT